MTADNAVHFNKESNTLFCNGNWDAVHLPQLKALFSKINWPKSGEVIFDGQDLKKMDSAGAWLLLVWRLRLEARGLSLKLVNFSHRHLKLLAIIEKNIEKEQAPLHKPEQLSSLPRLGKDALKKWHELLSFFDFVGYLALEVLRVLRRPVHLRIAELGGVIYRAGWQALPIIALLSFMIGVVLAYQMGLQLKNYGANIYIVDLVGIATLREFAPLITAIMVAGRTGSAYTAQLGMMKINQEIDALDTMGVTPAEVLVLPRIIGLFIALPLLTMWANIFGVFGGMIMANNMLNITWYDFLHRFPQAVQLKTLIIGLGKAPVFALIIASIGCFQGVKVERNAESVGTNTTRSVVLAIFFIIVADALFSVIFSKVKL